MREQTTFAKRPGGIGREEREGRKKGRKKGGKKEGKKDLFIRQLVVDRLLDSG
jgi:hypothetical protein